MAQTIVLISGANQGLGYETAKALLSQTNESISYHVIIASRDLAKATAAAESLHAVVQPGASLSTIQLDITDNSSVDAAAAHVDAQFGRLDILVNNAAIFKMQGELAAQLATNVTGTAGLTEAMLPLLQKSQSPSPRLIFVSTSMGSLSLNADPNFPFYGQWAEQYRVTKAAVNMLLVLYNNKLQGIKVIGADPGFCATNVIGDPDAMRKMGAVEPEVGGRFIATVVNGEGDEHAGKLVGINGVVPW